MLKLTKKADYGLMALKYLAEHPETPALSAKDVADAYGIPAQLLAKILQLLTKNGLLRSHAGVNGGYALARDARTVSVTGSPCRAARYRRTTWLMSSPSPTKFQ